MSTHKMENSLSKGNEKMEKQGQIAQPSLFQAQLDPNTEMLLDKLQACDPNRMTPIESLMLVSELKKLADKQN